MPPSDDTPEEAPSAEEPTEAEAYVAPKHVPEITKDGHIDGERLKQWLENYLMADQ